MPTRLTLLLTATALATATSALSGCYVTPYSTGTVHATASVEPGVVYVRQPPPALQATVTRPPQPAASAIWVDGHWDWQGRWVWAEGRWENPRPGHVWTPPVAVNASSGGYNYHPGYWRPADSRPPHVYTRPGAVRVSVTPAHEYTGTVHVSSPPAGQVHVTSPPSHPNQGHVTPGRVHVTPNQPATHGPATHGRVTVTPTQPVTQGRVTVTPTQPATQGRVTVTPTQPATHGRVTIAPGQSTTPGHVARTTPPPGTVRGNVTTQVNVQPGHVRPGTVQGGGQVSTGTVPAGTVRGNVTPNVNVRPGHVIPGTVQGGGRVTTPAPAGTVRGSVTPNVNVQPGRVAPGQVRTPTPRVNATVQPGTVSAGNANVNVSNARVETPDNTNLRCSMNINRAPRGGLITLSGNGFGAQTSVKIGGRLAVITNRQGSQLRVEVPRNSNGGAVVVESNNRSASCGMLNIIGG